MNNLLYLLTLNLLRSTPSNSSSKTPNDLCIKLSDILVDSGGLVYNLSRFLAFYFNVNKGVNDSIRVIVLDVEGNPIILNLSYDGDIIKLIKDYSYTKGYPYDKVKSYKGNNIVTETDDYGTKYWLYDNDTNITSLFFSNKKFEL